MSAENIVTRETVTPLSADLSTDRSPYSHLRYEPFNDDKLKVELTIDHKLYQVYTRYNGKKFILCDGVRMPPNEFTNYKEPFYDNGYSVDEVVRFLKKHLKAEAKREYEQKQLNLNLTAGGELCESYSPIPPVY